ncbi:myotubularin isoform 2 [Reticulomyxa filosa]|uniref:Myotubularin isoform 2 n=1 Tax=Reticulomyxa filosa TaxID=46433 RepID=X6MAY0_RETFI|nr:myotubularin isoform 2 [Reticulomyxa filosa]|eukprot:ETO10195.1 myotubularin isoform 2 [Reticulomyxa filosa]
MMEEEYRRLGWKDGDPMCPFRVSKLNVNYELCDTYPTLLLVPQGAKDDLLTAAASYRSRNRLPVITWANAQGVTLSRCSQPTSGMVNRRNTEDEDLLALINKINTCSNSFVICDCRPRANAMANKIQGKGFEGDSYAQSHLMFFDIENIHKMRHSLALLKKCCENQLDSNWYLNLNETKWVQHLSKILQCARRVAHMCNKDKYSVLVHCSDGWDRTAQVCALAELLLDPFYRTFKGFEVLIRKEWLWFGHNFLDCVYQIMCQYSWAFEFTHDLVMELMLHLNSGRFGDFFCNCQKEREDMQLWIKTPSLWRYLHRNWKQNKYRNPGYKYSQDMLKPRYYVRDLTLWDDAYCRFTSHDQDKKTLKPIDISLLPTVVREREFEISGTVV